PWRNRRGRAALRGHVPSRRAVGDDHTPHRPAAGSRRCRAACRDDRARRSDTVKFLPFMATPERQQMREHEDPVVHFRSDGLAPTPAEYARLLARLAGKGDIAADEFSREGVVAELERRMAALLGKEAGLFLPSGTLANHLALRLLATRGRRVLVQCESHI